MKKIIMTLLLLLMFSSVIFGANGTVVLYYDNGTVSYTDTKTYYEFDVLAYISGGEDTARFQEGQIYVQYDTGIFGTYVVANGKLASIALKGPLAETVGSGPVFDLYDFVNPGNDTYSDAFSLTFEYQQDPQYYGAATYISNSSGSLDTLMTIKMEVSASGSSVVDWPSNINDINLLFRDIGDGTTYEALSIANATETTQITYSDTGEPALPITLEELQVQYVNSSVALKWTTESETENLGYVIKRAIKYGDSDLSPYEIIASYHDNDDLLGAGTTVESNSYVYYDKNVKPGVSYSYILQDVDYNGNVKSHGPVSIVIPENYLVENDNFKLGNNFPNPFNPSFTVPLELMTAMDVNIEMFDITGRRIMTIANGIYEPRQYQFRVNASTLNSGIYFVRSIIGDQVYTQKMTLLK